MNKNIAEHIAHDRGYEQGFNSGKKFAQDKVLELMNEVTTEYEKMAENDVDPEIRAQISACRFMKSWVMSGGHTDLDGDRACLPW